MVSLRLFLSRSPWRRGEVAAFGALLLAAFVCYGGFGLSRLGFYLDDWHLLSGVALAPPGWTSAMRGLLAQAGAIGFRPLEIPIFAGLYWLNGLDPLRWQLSLLTVNLAAAWNLRGLLLRFGADGGAALLAALLLLAWPGKDATLFWPSTVFLPVSLAAFLGAYRLHLDFVENGSIPVLGGAAVCLLVALTSYDQCLLLFPLWLLVPSRGPAARRRALGGVALAAALAFLTVAYQLWLAPRLLGHPHNKSMIFSPSQALFVYARGLDALFGPALASSALASAGREAARSPLLAACAALAAAVTLVVGGEDRPEAFRRRRLALAAGFVLLGYLPIAVSNYVPTPFSHMNRINLVPAVGAAILAGEVLRLFRRAQAGQAAGVALAWSLLVASAGSAGSWAESYRRQLELRRTALSQLDLWPRECTLLLRLPELFVNGAVPVFLAHYDSSGAFRLWTGDPGRKADVLAPETRFLPEGVDNNGRRTPYALVRVLDAASGRILRLGVRPPSFGRPPEPRQAASGNRRMPP